MNKESNSNIDQWREWRIGLFIHWGLYSATEGYWGGVETKGICEWIQQRERIPLAQYKEYAKEFTLERFNADQWMEEIKAAGFKYIVYTAKHHEGFAMYDTKWDDYSVTKMGQSHKDPAKELTEAAQKKGIQMCFYYSQAHDWADKDAVGNDWDFNEADKNFENFLEGKCKYQLKELLTNYGDLGLIWFDVPQGISKQQSEDLKKYVKQIQPKCLVSGRISSEPGIGDYGSLGDNQLPKGRLEGDWETPVTLNHTWGYKRDDNNWKSAEEIISLITDLLSKGVNCLINIGPKANGEIPEQSLNILRAIGGWMKINSQAVYGTMSSPFLTEFSWGNVSVKNDNMFLYVKRIARTISLSGLRTDVKKAVLLSENDLELAYKQSHNNTSDQHVIEIEMPAENKNKYVNVIKLELSGAIDVVDYICQQPDRYINLPAYLCKIHKNEQKAGNKESGGGDIAVEAEQFNLSQQRTISVGYAGVVENWHNASDYIEWEFVVYHSAVFQIELRTFGRKYESWVGGHCVRVECAGQTVRAVLKADAVADSSSRHYFSETASNVGVLRLEAGRHKLCLYADDINKQDPAGLLVSEMILKEALDQGGERIE